MTRIDKEGARDIAPIVDGVEFGKGDSGMVESEVVPEHPDRAVRYADWARKETDRNPKRVDAIDSGSKTTIGRSWDFDRRILSVFQQKAMRDWGRHGVVLSDVVACNRAGVANEKKLSPQALE